MLKRKHSTDTRPVYVFIDTMRIAYIIYIYTIYIYRVYPIIIGDVYELEKTNIPSFRNHYLMVIAGKQVQLEKGK